MNDVPKDILIKAAEGDREAFKEIYRLTSGFVYSVAIRILGKPEDAEEVTQDVFLKVHHSLKGFGFRSAFKTWLYRITINTSLSEAKKSTKEKLKQGDYETAIQKVSEPSSMDKKQEKEEGELKISKIMSYLNLDQRACLLLRAIEGLNYEQIAEVLETNINTVRTRLKRAREVLIRNMPKEVRGYGL